MSGFTSSLLRLAVLAGLLSFTHGDAFAQSANAPIGSAVQPPPRNLIQPQQQVATGDSTASTPLRGPEQRVALVIGNANYQNAPQLPNPDHDAQSMAQFLNAAGFEVVEATDLTQNDMIKVVQDFSAKVAAHGPNTVAMIYYAGHGVQLAGENYLVPIDAKVTSPSDLINNSVRLVDLMATLESIPSRMRIVVLDACRNNPFPTVDDAGRGLAIVDAPNGSIVGYSTAPGTEALDGNDGHSPYTNAFLHLAHEPNVPIEQLFKRIRLEVNHATSGQQTPWESSSLTSDFTFFGDTAVAATRAPTSGPVVQMASNLPSHAARQAYDFVVSEGSPAFYQEFLDRFPYDPLCDNIRVLLANLLEAAAWHSAVLSNSPLAYKAFYQKHPTSFYALSAVKLASQPKSVPLMQPTHLLNEKNLAPTTRLTNVVTLPAPGSTTASTSNISKIVTLPVQNKTGPTPETTTIRKDDRIEERPDDRETGGRKTKTEPTLEKRPVFNKPAGGTKSFTRFAMGGGGHGGFRR
jgi:hypothetical protein